MRAANRYTYDKEWAVDYMYRWSIVVTQSEKNAEWYRLIDIEENLFVNKMPAELLTLTPYGRQKLYELYISLWHISIGLKGMSI